MKVHKRIWAGCLAVVLVVAVFAGLAGAQRVSYAYDEKSAIIKVNSSVYVRTEAGTGMPSTRALSAVILWQLRTWMTHLKPI